MARVVQMNDLRAKALESYSSVRSYHLECHCLSHKKADMMPGEDGGVIAERMKKIKPSVPILMLSAYIDLPSETFAHGQKKY